MVAVGTLTVHLMGMHMNELAQSKLGASDEARQAISRMVEEIRTCGMVHVGNGSLTEFTNIETGAAQIGNALQIYPSKTNTSLFVRYFWDERDRRLKRTDNGETAVMIVANSITNAMVFTAEDHNGTVLSNNFNNRVIGVSLQFYQLQYPPIRIGPGSLYDFYQLHTKITRRALE
jgi:hypothetical protein